MDEQENKVKVISNPKIASYLINKGFKLENIKKHRDFYCNDACKICDKKTVFAFVIEDGFLEELAYAIKNYEVIGWCNDKEISD